MAWVEMKINIKFGGHRNHKYCLMEVTITISIILQLTVFSKQNQTPRNVENVLPKMFYVETNRVLV
jgi:hypothetical protein